MALKGIYVLAVLVSRDITVEVGSLGRLLFKRGFYAYVGSAQNSLGKRLERHVWKMAKRKFWHIDHLLSVGAARVVGVFTKEAEKREECNTAQSLARLGFPVGGFGCSDCRCKSHLFMFNSYSVLEKACLELGFKPLPVSHCTGKHLKPGVFPFS
ncbi:MAG: GIY-YIG nuclease family protein [Candidatus Bathyarchaeia archaeon]